MIALSYSILRKPNIVFTQTINEKCITKSCEGYLVVLACFCVAQF